MNIVGQKGGADATGDSDTAFVGLVVHELDKSCQSMDGHTLSRLNGIRHAVLENRRVNKRPILLFPFGGLATAAILVLSISLLNTVSGPGKVGGDSTSGSSPLEDIDILTSSDSLDLFEDYEFYQWLAENESSV